MSLRDFTRRFILTIPFFPEPVVVFKERYAYRYCGVDAAFPGLLTMAGDAVPGRSAVIIVDMICVRAAPSTSSTFYGSVFDRSTLESRASAQGCS